MTLKNKILSELSKRGLDEFIKNEDKTTSENLFTLSESTVDIINERIADEYYAHFLYRYAYNWCADANYKKAAKFFLDESNTELEHAKILEKYLTDFNIIPVTPKIGYTFNINTLPNLIHEGYKTELKLMKEYNECSRKLFNEDLTTFDFLQQFRIIQKESVIEYNDLINGLQLIDSSNKLDVLYFENNYF